MSDNNQENHQHLTFSDLASCFFDNFDLIDWNLWNTTATSNADHALQQTVQELDALIKALEPNGLTPYENLKIQLFGENHKFPTLDELPVPSIEQLAGVHTAIDQHIRMVNNDIIDTLQQNPKATAEDLDFVGFRVKQGDKNVLDINKLKCYIEMLELITESNDKLNDETTKDISSKLLYKCYQFCKM
jgi:hypothetical protein